LGLPGQGAVEFALKAPDNDISVDGFVGVAGVIERGHATRDEFALVNSTLNGGTHRLFDKFRQGFALILPSFSGRVSPIDTAVALRCAQLQIPNRRAEWDALIDPWVS
jgi:hypothetical protein